MIPKAASSPENQNLVLPAMVQLLNWTPWGQKHITGMSWSVLQLTPFHSSPQAQPLIHTLSLERKYIHILIEIKIQTYCKKLNKAAARCAMGTLLSVRTEEESKKIFLAWSPTPLHIDCALPEILPHVYNTVYRTIFRTSMENQPDKKKKPTKIQ